MMLRNGENTGVWRLCGRRGRGEEGGSLCGRRPVGEEGGAHLGQDSSIGCRGI